MTTKEEFRQCRDDHVRWAALQYDLGDWHYLKTRFRVYAEVVCAPRPPQEAQVHRPVVAER